MICLAERFVAIAAALKEGFGLSLFGFDVIVPNDRKTACNSEYVVIDVNFFPSYKEVGDFPSRLRSFLWEHAASR